MSRPDSPIKFTNSPEEIIKKLKLLLIKEKKINKENERIINDLKAEDGKKMVENNLLIDQVQRLSESIGQMGEFDNEEFDRLKITVKELKFENQQLKTEDARIHEEIKDFIGKVSSNIRCLMDGCSDVLVNDKAYTNQCDTLIDVDDYICCIFEGIKSALKSKNDVNNVLQDGLDRITFKCNDLESVIESKDERIKVLNDNDKELKTIVCELSQREEQIKRLEELIEDNRNISRALETERDQLQNDLMDLRQRHEEKEGYLIEEYREAQQSLENYRIFTDKQSAEKGNEIERLRKCLDEYQRNIQQESFLPECGLCRDISSLFVKLKQEFVIDDLTLNHYDVVTLIIEKYKLVKGLLDRKIEELQKNDHKCRREVELLSEKLDSLELALQGKEEESVSSEMQLIEELSNKLLLKENEIYLLKEEVGQFKSLSKEIQELLDCKDSSMIIDSMKHAFSLNEKLKEELELVKCHSFEQIETLEETLLEKNGCIVELTDKLSAAGKHVNHNDLMSLEMAEIDRTLISLNSQLTTKTAKVNELECTVETISDKIQGLERQNQVLEERNNKIKQMLIKTKRELAEFKSQSATLQEKETVFISEVELLNTQLEDTKVLLSEAVNEKERLQERYSTYSKKMDAITKSREMTINNLRSQSEGTTQSYKCLQQEFDLYKIKVQTAFNTKLRSPSTFSDFMTISTTEKASSDDTSVKSFNKQISDLEMKIDDLKIDSREKDDKIFALNSDLDLLRWEHDKLSEKYRQSVKENHELTVKVQHTMDQLQADSKLHQLSHSDMVERFNLEKEKLSTIHLSHLESVRSEYEIEMESLTQKLEEKELEKLKFQEEVWDCREQLKTADNRLGQIKFSGNEQNRSSINDIWGKQMKLPVGQERQQGEGMEMKSEAENVALPSHSKIASPATLAKSSVYNNTFVSLGQLLNSSLEEEEQQKVAEGTIQALKAESSSYRKRNEHLAELLNDTEETVARLTEQALLLKAEIRRLEKNEERDRTLEDAASREYLKNVIVKFLHQDTGADERCQLVPVLGTLLSLDAGERDLLARFSRVGGRREAEGWGSYFGWAGAS